MSALSHREPLDVLEEHFGFRKFLDGQEPIVRSILEGRDALAIMPTGGGKSLCYQLPALCMEGLTVVVSPLIALMKDQVDALVAKGISATVINSTLSGAEQSERIAAMRRGEFKLVYIAPERFRSRQFTETLRQVHISLFAIDEAHCLSQWGHDFRPDYMRLGEAIERIGRPQTAAFTATATPEVRADILQTLRLRDPYVCLSGFERPNLSLTVTHAEKKKVKLDRLQALIQRHKTGIVYCATRKRVEEVSEILAGWRVSMVTYHGGLNEEEREEAQNKFISRKADVAVATNAFGMGIDRSDVRFVAHYDIPGSVEAYYQEAGRAGRDGEPSSCELLFNFADTRTQEFFIEGANPGVEGIQRLFEMLKRLANSAGEVEVTIGDLADHLGESNSMRVSSALSALAKADDIERYDIPGKRMRGTRVLRGDLQLDHLALTEKERRDRGKLEAMVQLCYSDDCRQGFILDYFGQEDFGPCGTCDNCRAGIKSERRQGTAEEVTDLRKALSGIARCCQRTASGLEPRYGKGKIVQMLVGSRSQEVLSTRLDELSTYGLLKEKGSPYVYELLREAEKKGYVYTTKVGQFPLIGITPKGIGVMKDGGQVTMLWPKPASPQSLADMIGSDARPDSELYDKLRAKRGEIASQESVPAYVVFNNQTLELMAALKPKSLAEGAKIKGIGPSKIEKYLPAFIDVVRAHMDA